MGLYHVYPQKSGIKKRGMVRVAFFFNVFIWLSWSSIWDLSCGVQDLFNCAM